MARHSWLERLRLAGHVIYSFEARRRLRRFIQEFRPDVAHVRGIYHHLSPSILSELKSQAVPVVYHINDFKLLCPSYNLVSHGKVCERCSGGKSWHVIAEGCHQGPKGSALVLAAEAYVHRWLRTYEKCVDLFLAPSCFVREKLVEHRWDPSRLKPFRTSRLCHQRPHPRRFERIRRFSIRTVVAGKG